MVSQKSDASSQESFERQKQNSTGSDFLKDLESWHIKDLEPEPGFLHTDYKARNRAVVVRDFSFPPSRVQAPLSQDLVQPALSDESEPMEESEFETKESSKEVELKLSGYGYGSVPGNNISLNSFGLSLEDEGIDMSKVVGSVGLVDTSETSDQYGFVENVPSNFISPIVLVDTSDSMSFKTKEHSHQLSNAQGDSEENTYEFPKDLEPWKRFDSECSSYAISWDTNSSGWVYDSSSDSEDLDAMPLYTTQESERKDLRQALDTPNSTPIDIVVISDDEEDIKSPKKVTPVLLSKGYKPYRRVSAVRDFPIPPSPTSGQTPFPEDLVHQLVGSVGLVGPSETSEYGFVEEVASNFISPIVHVNKSDSTSFETKKLFHKLSNAQDPLDAQSDSEESYCNSKLKNSHKPVPKRKAKSSMEAEPGCQGSTRKRRKH